VAEDRGAKQVQKIKEMGAKGRRMGVWIRTLGSTPHLSSPASGSPSGTALRAHTARFTTLRHFFVSNEAFYTERPNQIGGDMEVWRIRVTATWAFDGSEPQWRVLESAGRWIGVKARRIGVAVTQRRGRLELQ
jgi:hypothetical protein